MALGDLRQGFIIWSCLVVSAAIFCSNMAFAQVASTSRVRPGMSEEQLVELLGDPDRKSSEQGKVQFWHYGRSMIIISDGLIQGVSNRGDLDNWKPKTQLKENKEKLRKPEIGDDWINLWSPPTSNMAEDLGDFLR